MMYVFIWIYISIEESYLHHTAKNRGKRALVGHFKDARAHGSGEVCPPDGSPESPSGSSKSKIKHLLLNEILGKRSQSGNTRVKNKQGACQREKEREKIEFEWKKESDICWERLR